MASAGAYLVIRHEDGYGEVFPLQQGQRYTLGRANTNRIVLKDDLCSREHAEVYHAEGRWRLRDLGSRNGTRLNGATLDSEWELGPGDEFLVGRSHFLFVERLEELPDVSPSTPTETGVAIKERLGQTRYLTPQPENIAQDGPPLGLSKRHSLSRDLALLYRLALDMGGASNYEEVASIVLEGIFEAVPAEVGAILTMKEGRELEVTTFRHRDNEAHEYTRVSEFVSNEVISSQEAILAESVARDRYLKDRESLNFLGATSLICAPIVFAKKVLGLIHLYCLDPHKALTREDLEFAMALAKQLGTVIHQMQRQQSLSAENQSLRDQLRVESELVGDSPVMKAVEEQIGLVAGTTATVLIRGESGSGKELVARAIHYSSPRKDGPFVCLNCAALTETLLE